MVPGLFISEKVALKLFVDPIFFEHFVESVFFYSGTVTREVKSGKWDYKMAEAKETRQHFVPFYDGKRPGKEGELKSVHYSPCPTLSGTRPW